MIILQERGLLLEFPSRSVYRDIESETRNMIAGTGTSREIYYKS